MLHWSGQGASIIGSQAAATFAIASMTRVGAVLAAIWLAWDSLRRPARWLPPGLAMIGVAAIIAIAVQPRLMLAVIPLMGVIGVVAVVVNAFRR